MMAVTPSNTVRIKSGGMQRAIHWGLEDMWGEYLCFKKCIVLISCTLFKVHHS